MKFVLVFAALCGLALATPLTTTKGKVIPKKYKIQDMPTLTKIEKIHRLLKNVNQPTYDTEFVDLAKFKPWTHLDLYHDAKYVEEFFHYYNTDILPRGEVFSMFYQEHLKPAIALFKLFYHAKDYETFFKTAVWARQHVNEGMFLYSFTVALVHRDDTFGIPLPPIHEIYPYYFFNTETIHKAQFLKQTHNQYPTTNKDGFYTIETNYSGWYMNVHPEQSLSYFTEDVGLNSFYYYYHVHYPFWMNDDEFGFDKDRRGELFYFVHQQLLARYYLERLSNGFGEIDELKFEFPIETGYYPSLEYPNGLQFPVRPNHVDVGKHWEYNYPHFSNMTNSYTYVMDYARRIRDAIDIGFVFKHDGTKVSLYGKEGLEILGDILEGNPDSPNLDFYGILQIYARHILGYAPTPLHKYKVVPSALEHYETSLRDPVFWQFYKYVMTYFYEYKNHLPTYKKEHLEHKEIEIVNFEIDRLVTYFEDFYSHLGQAVFYNEKEFTQEPFKVHAKQERLTHKPFTYKVNVKAEKDMNVIGKVFLGPKFDEYDRTIDMKENKMNFVLIDKFFYHLKTGMNVVERNSNYNFHLVPDRTSYYDLYKKIVQAIDTNDKVTIDGSEAYWGFPNRLMLPKGTTGGQTFQMYVIFYPMTKTIDTTTFEEIFYPSVKSGVFDVDTMPMGYPFTSNVEWFDYKVKNSFFKDVVITHKNYKDLNVTH